jgi:glutaconate CoA-transferase subunit A
MSVISIDNLVSRISDGAKLAIPTSRSGVAMAATRALIRRGVRDLHLVTIPTAGIQADMLIGAECVTTVESAGVTLDEHGQAGRFVAAVKTGSIKLMDTTCPAIISGLQAGEKGVPFFPMRGLIGSDLLANRQDYRVIDNPMAEAGDPIVILPAIVPDIALFHAAKADRFGNVWIGKMRELMTMAHAAKQTFVTVEEIIDGNLMDDNLYAPATIPELFISHIAIAKRGAWPLGLDGVYPSDDRALSAYAKAAGNPDSFGDYLREGADQAVE